MIVWIKKEAIRAQCNQRGKVLQTNGSKITIRLLDDNRHWGIHPRDIIGLEISECLTIKFKCTGHQTAETYCRNCGERV